MLFTWIWIGIKIKDITINSLIILINIPYQLCWDNSFAKLWNLVFICQLKLDACIKYCSVPRIKIRVIRIGIATTGTTKPYKFNVVTINSCVVSCFWCLWCWAACTCNCCTRGVKGWNCCWSCSRYSWEKGWKIRWSQKYWIVCWKITWLDSGIDGWIICWIVCWVRGWWSGRCRYTKI